MNDITLEYYGSVSETGEITLPKRMRKEMSKAFQGHNIEVTVRRKRHRRSNNQNAYYWSVVVPAVVRVEQDSEMMGEFGRKVTEFVAELERVLLLVGAEKMDVQTIKTATK